MGSTIIFGGHGKIALLATPILREDGITVTSVIRDPEQRAGVEAAGGVPLVKDIEHLSTEELAEIIAGHDSVVWSAGAGGGNPARTMAVDRDAARRTMDAAEQAGVKRYVMVSYFGSSPDHGIDPDNSFYAYADAKAVADEYLRASGLDWTVLAPSTLTLESPTGSIDTTSATSETVSRGNVARVIAAVLADDRSIHRTIRFNDGDTPIADALDEIGA
ncbi:SDR family oxidoreductase [Leucobacter luti]|uniref:SDR family oxidoreductase n=1 Tax=Leucobacter luti TaxID=340320 RepID=UPI003D085D04